MNSATLITEAKKARENAYVPYSYYAVGAALLSKSGKIYHGCNIESASYSPTNCAERTAFFKAVSEGERGFEAIAVVGAPEGDNFSLEELEFAFPCGVCRQVMKEFCNPQEFKIIVGKSEENFSEYTLDELLPHAFGPENL